MKSMKEILQEWSKRADIPCKKEPLLYDKTNSHDYLVSKIRLMAKNTLDKMENDKNGR